MNISRRKFLIAAPAVAGAVLHFQGSAFAQRSGIGKLPPSVVPVATDALSRLSWNSFLPYINTDFTFGEGGDAITLKLASMTDSRKFGVPRMKDQENFVLKFVGPSDQTLGQGTYKVNHFSLGDFDLFITDGSRVKRSQQYIAIINRIAG